MAATTPPRTDRLKIPQESLRNLQPFLSALILVLQSLVVYIWQDHVDDYTKLVEKVELNQVTLNHLKVFEAETVANRFTSQDALEMNMLLQQLVTDKTDDLKNCINLVARGKDCY